MHESNNLRFPQWNYDDPVKDEIVRVRRESRLSGIQLPIIHGGEPGPETVDVSFVVRIYDERAENYGIGDAV